MIERPNREPPFVMRLEVGYDRTPDEDMYLHTTPRFGTGDPR